MKHTELGAALCVAHTMYPEPRIVVFSEDREKFETKGVTCAFYHHPLVERFSDMSEMIKSLLGDQ